MENEAEPLKPGVYLVGTPIGNLEDVGLRTLRVLSRVDVLACEDTRVTRKLFQRHGLPAPKTILVANDHNERSVAERLAAYAGAGKAVAFCSDAGMPGISDPGFNIVRAAREAGVYLTAVPGPNAAAMAVSLCGLPAAGFTFLGFPPRRDGRLRELLETHRALPPALVFYESANRLARLFRMASEHVGRDREAAACLELTKKYERVLRGTVSELADLFAPAPPRGEATVVIAGASRKAGGGDDREDDAE